MAVRRLKKDGLVRVQSGGEVSLTAAGRKIARKLTLRHHLIERMLAEMFGMEWYKVHDEAERLEHAVSPDFEAKLLAKLGAAGPVRTAISANWRVPPAAAGADCCCWPTPRRAANYLVSGIYERDRRLLEFLEQRGIRPGAQVHVSGRNYDHTLTLDTDAGTVSLGGSAAEKVWVTQSSGGSPVKPARRLRPLPPATT